MSLVLAFMWFLIWNLGAFSPPGTGEAPIQHWIFEGPFLGAGSCQAEANVLIMYHNGPLVTVQPQCVGLPTWP
jgi:hypothetical protein